jgi:hypothetical protein
MKKKTQITQPSDIRVIKAKRVRYTAFKKCSKEIFHAFISSDECNSPGILVNEITPWECFSGSDDEAFDRLYEAIQLTFALSYTIGQGLDLPGIDTKPIWDQLKEKKTLLCFPHKKKVA